MTKKFLFWIFWRWKIWYFWTKNLMEIWHLLITEKFLFWSFWELEIPSFLSQKVDGKIIFNIYWLLKSSCFELFGNRKYSFLQSPEVDEMIFTGYWEVLVLNFSVIENTVFFSVKRLMERWYLLGLFELSMIFQDLGNMVFRTLWSHKNKHRYLWLLCKSLYRKTENEQWKS